MKITGLVSILVVSAFFADHALAQSPDTGSAGSQANTWSFSLALDGYVVPDTDFYVSPTLAADYDWAHLEARYNYEDQHTGSLWAGYNFGFGNKLRLEVTPMLGGVFGDTTGIAPGCEISLTYKNISFDSSSEYVFDTTDSSASFFYSWPQLTYSPLNWLQVGLVAQRTKAYETSLELQRGFLVGVSRHQFEFTSYVFNLGWTDPTFVFGFAVDF